jgi:hypothetical protein
VALLSKGQILDAEDLTTEDVEVPEWGGTVRVRSLTGTERDKFETDMVDKHGKATKLGDIRARLAALCMVDAKGQRLFSDAEAHALGKKSGAALERVSSVAMRLAGLTQDDVEELAGN